MVTKRLCKRSLALPSRWLPLFLNPVPYHGKVNTKIYLSPTLLMLKTLWRRPDSLMILPLPSSFFWHFCMTFLHVLRSTFSLYHDTIKSICNDCFTFCLLLWKSSSPKLAPKLHWVFSIVWKKHNASRARRNPYMNVWKMRRSLKTARHNGMLIICVNILNWTWERAFEELEPISNFCFLTRFFYTLSIIVRHNSWR